MFTFFKKHDVLFFYIALVSSVIIHLIPDMSLKNILNILFLYLFLLLLSYLSKILFLIALFIIDILGIFTTHIFLHWGGEITFLDSRIDTALQSTDSETWEYVSTYITLPDFFLIGFLILMFSITYLCYSHKKLSKKIQYNSLLLALLMLIILQNQHPLRLIKNFITSYTQNKTIHTRTNYLNSLPKYIQTNHKKGLYDTVVLIQGESVNKSHMHLYNYPLNTTPFLDSMLQKHTLYRFNAIAPTNQTRYSIPTELLPINIHQWENDFASSPSLISVFKQHNYKTYWISNQGKNGKHDDYIYNIASEANRLKFFNIDFKHATTDLILTDYLKKQNFENIPSFYFLHLMGSHANYQARYTSSHLLYPHPKDTIESYDNSIYFTDMILQKIFNTFLTKNKSKNILIIYLSDHGEIVSNSKHGHGFAPPKKDEYNIPFVIYSNIENPRLKELQKKTLTKTINTESLHSIIAYLNHMTNKLNISFSTDVICLSPNLIMNYQEMKNFTQETDGLSTLF